MIREAKPGEGSLIAEEFWYPLATEMAEHSVLNELTEDALAVAREGFEELLAEDQRYDFLLEDEGTAVGYISAETGTRPTRKRGKYASIIDLYVKEGHRGQGHGTALVEHVEQLAAREDCDFLRVSAEWDNAGARDFYEKHGYGTKQVKYAKVVE
mgnify:CR=1 FL=1